MDFTAARQYDDNMTCLIPPSRRRLLLIIAGTILSKPLAGCLERNGSTSSSDTLGEQPFPQELVGVADYGDELEDSIERNRFPDPDASLIPELSKARFVADAARDAGDVEFANRIEHLRDPVFEPLVRFEAVTTLIDERRRNRLDETEVDELVSKAGIDEEEVTLDDDPETIIDTALDDRELTFFDYPAPPLHVIEGSESRGRELLDENPDEREREVSDERRTYVNQRAKTEAIVVGARDLAVDAYDDVIEQIRTESLSNRAYENEETYAEVVAFNAALAAEAMLEADGEIITPP